MTSSEKSSPALSIHLIKAICHDAEFLSLAKTLLHAMAFEAVEKKRVDAYIQPVFERFTFNIAEGMGDDAGEKITDRDRIWLASDEQTAPYYEACDVAHRENGFTGPKGYCPALIAHHDLINAENALLEFTVPKIAPGRDWCLHGKLRADALNLFLQMATKTAPSGYFNLPKAA